MGSICNLEGVGHLTVLTLPRHTSEVLPAVLPLVLDVGVGSDAFDAEWVAGELQPREHLTE